MNTANKLTLLRIFLVPLMIIIYYLGTIHLENDKTLNSIYLIGHFNVTTLINLIIFCVASFTDFLDGYIARKRDEVTTFGKFLDPLADKMLTFTAFTFFLYDGFIPMWIYLILLIREFAISALRLVLVQDNLVVQASVLAKYKTASMMVTIILFFFVGIDSALGIRFFYYTATSFLYVTLILSIVSFFEYFIKNIKHLKFR